MALSSQLAIVVQQLHDEQASHLDTVNRLRVGALGLSQLRDSHKLVTFRDDLVLYVEKIVQVATAREAAKRETKEDKTPVGAPFLG